MLYKKIIKLNYLNNLNKKIILIHLNLLNYI